MRHVYRFEMMGYGVFWGVKWSQNAGQNAISDSDQSGFLLYLAKA
jgi:hypothetical protein